MFDGAGSNEAGLLAAVYFLLQRIKGSDIRKKFKSCYPIQDNSQRREFKTRLREELSALEETGAIPLGTGRGSTLNMAKGKSAQVLVWCLTVAAMLVRIEALGTDAVPPRLESEQVLLSRDRSEDLRERFLELMSEAEDDFARACARREERTRAINDLRDSLREREARLAKDLQQMEQDNSAFRADLDADQETVHKHREAALRTRDLLLELGSDTNNDMVALRQQLNVIAAQNGAEAGVVLPSGCASIQQVLEHRIRPQLDELRGACSDVLRQVPAELAPLRAQVAAQNDKTTAALSAHAREEVAMKQALLQNAKAVLAQALR
ncbi:AUGMIN subunit 6 [Hondaea fermentalgiana]|uniref:AUGMIN subunit 6 n=1 Tax=Hondaea fermentalgiana TaxID=2315210 RepID=A0A2R5G9F9_9STRA|nr:AUGMIN subunit 6 [Hondaea fermentalgiana]|eukprot:GBG27667.1 AUGMIN subunit 6 [Hondaea fermentalgiana]